MTTRHYPGWHIAPLALAGVVACAGGPSATVRPLTPEERAETVPCSTREETVWSSADLDTLLTVIAADPPYYPLSLRDNAKEGHVRFSLVIQPTGRVDPCSLTIVDATDPEFVPEARKAVLGIRFAPPRRQGQAVSARHTQSITFRLPQSYP